MNSLNKHRIGLVGTGFIASGFARLVHNHAPDLDISAVLTRRAPDNTEGFPFPERLTRSVQELLDKCDMIVECSGDVLHATDVIDTALRAGKPVVTMNSEFHVTTGSWFADKGLLTEAEGDQPGSIAALREEAVMMGFKPLVYGNMKGFLNHHPTPEEMAYWAGKQGISVAQTTSFTDGTKIQIEQALVANGFGGTITRQGMEGPKSADVSKAAIELARTAAERGQAISDYVLSPGNAGVFVVGTHDKSEWKALNYLKLGDGPYYVLVRPFHLCQYEIIKTVRRVINGGGVLLNNSSTPSISIVGIAKTDLPAGTRIDRAIGGFQVRGEAARIQDVPNHVPIGMIQNAVITRPVLAGQTLSFDDVELPDTLALDIARKLYA
ncbi:MAG: SAF domain-containing protein [Hydrogenophaga sp.]|jgi:predicted homoserine dehydrogenase-like protein|uniref:Gfo/Idh/MocA family oxidoreductase n=1 Tax=Hydrogenophaga sp. TaxID=1904254 RepID=UPI002750645E|nr:Gfo/Idh/MocA family oxidoreductase [Hydrogenophaga sp.]MDP2407688.1 SAF domain-containing protein [Hydrogenophaga sp.]MDZ4175300.1 SAF domain-containing protein [Hydrogenophaga sp.]